MTKASRPYFVIFGAMRTGSNFLQTVLNQADDLKCFGELFNPAFIDEQDRKQKRGWTIEDRDGDPIGFLNELMVHNPRRTIGFRMFAKHHPQMRTMAIQDPLCAKVILRRDPKDSYLSWKMARKTNVWLIGHQDNLKKETVRFERQEYENFTEKLNSFYEEVISGIEETKSKYFSINYDQLKELDKINELINHIGSRVHLSVVEEKIKKQNIWSEQDIIENYDEFCAYFDSLSGRS